MTLQEVVTNIKNIASQQPNVRTVTEGDVYDVMNTNPSVVYDVFHLTQQTHQEDEEYDYWRFNMFYISRLVDSFDNKLQVQSIGKSVISNVIRIFCDQFDLDFPDNTQLTYVAFTEKFADECAGVYCNVVLQIPKDLVCEDSEVPTVEITSNGYYYINNTKIKVDVQ